MRRHLPFHSLIIDRSLSYLRRSAFICGFSSVIAVALWFHFWLGCRAAGQPVRKLDPAAWGGDHVGKPVPEYVTGDECLFCHRKEIGASWGRNRHHLTLREAEADDPALASLRKSSAKALAGEVKLLLGGGNRVRFLKPSAAYGQLELCTASWTPPQGGKAGQLLNADAAAWDAKTFGDRCAGCHATGVNSKTRAFSSPSLDCYTCHGLVDDKHTKDASLALLGKKRNDPARVATSICAQCHIRTGQSKSSGLPYPNNFVAGDNLFRDFQVDFSDEAHKQLNPGDRHILENVRDVVVLGREDVTCLSCHNVHQSSTKKHHTLERTAYCQNCHQATGSMKIRKAYEVHSKLCGY